MNAGIHVGFIVIADEDDVFVAFGCHGQGLEADIKGARRLPPRPERSPPGGRPDPDRRSGPFKKLDGSRRSMFESLEKPALKPLAQEAYQYAEWKQAKVNIDYHVELDRHRYSVPHRLIGRRLEIRFTKTTVECFLKGERVAVHPRKYQPGGFTTITEHMPQVAPGVCQVDARADHQLDGRDRPFGG